MSVPSLMSSLRNFFPLDVSGRSCRTLKTYRPKGKDNSSDCVLLAGGICYTPGVNLSQSECIFASPPPSEFVFLFLPVEKTHKTLKGLKQSLLGGCAHHVAVFRR